MTNVRDMTAEEFYAYLRVECPDLAAAKIFMKRWASEWDSVFPGETEPCITSRALATHVSRVLEGQAPDAGRGITNYIETCYGPELYIATWEG